jgi:hypothetical protein
MIYLCQYGVIEIENRQAFEFLRPKMLAGKTRETFLNGVRPRGGVATV